MKIIYLFTALLLFACSSASSPEIAGFDVEAWKSRINDCSQSKVAMAETLIQHQDKLLGKGQSAIKSYLGAPYANELYQRNQKFFYYKLTAGDTCASVDKPLMLSIRFDAIDRVKELMIVE